MKHELTPWFDARQFPNAVHVGFYVTRWRYDGKKRHRAKHRNFYSYWDGSSWCYGHRTLAAAVLDCLPVPVRPQEAAAMVAWCGTVTPNV